jgi:hypothetical protein
MKLALISLYQVVKHKTNGITSVHSQQIAWLHKCGWLEDPKTAMLRDPKVALQTPQQNNVMIIVGGDFNESNKNLGLHYMLATELELQDIWEYYNLYRLPSLTESFLILLKRCSQVLLKNQLLFFSFLPLV